jgi:hypothetical protein
MGIRYEIVLRDFFKRLSTNFLSSIGREYFSDINVRVMLFIAGATLLATWLVAIFRFTPSTFMVPIRYNSFLGVTQIGNWYDLYYVPVVSTFCYFLNMCLGGVVYKKDKMVGYILIAASIFVAVFALIIVINFSILVNS